MDLERLHPFTSALFRAQTKLFPWLRILRLGELGSLEEVVNQMLQHRPPLLTEPVLGAMWSACKQAHVARQYPSSAKTLRCGLTLLSMAAAKRPETVAENLQTLLEVKLPPQVTML